MSTQDGDFFYWKLCWQPKFSSKMVICLLEIICVHIITYIIEFFNIAAIYSITYPNMVWNVWRATLRVFSTYLCKVTLNKDSLNQEPRYNINWAISTEQCYKIFQAFMYKLITSLFNYLDSSIIFFSLTSRISNYTLLELMYHLWTVTGLGDVISISLQLL